MRRRIDPLYAASAVIAVVTLVVLAITATAPSSGATRSGSAFDEGAGGAGALRRFIGAMGASTSTLQGGSFDPGGASVLLIIGPSETITAEDTSRLQQFVRSGGTVVLASDLGILEGSLLSAFGMHVAGLAAPGAHPLSSPAFADPPARSFTIDRGVALAADARDDVLATDGRAPLIAAARNGSGLFIAVGSMWPFLGAGLTQADNARMVLALVRPALAGGGTVAFDEYHHGVHPSADILVLVQETWPGRALVFAAVVTFLYLVLTGRRLGAPIPLDPRPSRSSLDYIRGFAGLVRRSGRGEIARRRLRVDLRIGLARRLGVDPATPIDRIVNTLAAQDRAAAARARAIDDALARPLREAAMLRTVAQIDELVAGA